MRRCRCGNDRFHGHQVNHHDVVVDGLGNWKEDRGVYFSVAPFGPFHCTACGARYEDLADIPADAPGAEDIKVTVPCVDLLDLP